MAKRQGSGRWRHSVVFWSTYGIPNCEIDKRDTIVSQVEVIIIPTLLLVFSLCVTQDEGAVT